MPAPRHKASIHSYIKADPVPWWIMSACMLVVGSSAILAAISTERR
jgi:hypothetical protein